MRTSLALPALITAILTSAVPAVAAGERPEPAYGPDNPRAERTASILYVNDAHEIGPVLTGGQDRGGVARLAAVVNAAREGNPATFVTFGGDLAGGTLFGGLYKGFPMVDAFNRIGVGLANVGQHDFDFGLTNTRELVAASDFPWISANLTLTDGEPVLDGWHVERVGKIRVGFIGLTDAVDTSSVADQVIEHDPVTSARAAIADMTATANVDVVIALTQHPIEDNRRLVREVPEIDAVFGEEMAEYESVVSYEGGVPLMAPEGNMGSVIRLDLTKERDDVVVVAPEIIEVDHTVTPDPGLRALEEFYEQEMARNLSTVLATVETPLVNPDHASRRRETALGDFVADAFRARHGTDIGWVNGGGLRAEAPGPDFTKRDAYAIAPFDNKVMAVEVAGTGLLVALEQAVARVESLGGGFPQVSGMTYAYSPAAPAGSRVSDVTVGGVALDSGATYTVAVTNFVVRGGDGVSGFAGASVLVPASEAPADAEVIAGHAAALGVIDVSEEGRITVLP